VLDAVYLVNYESLEVFSSFLQCVLVDCNGNHLHFISRISGSCRLVKLLQDL